jgi:hypothetical protein
MKTEDIDGILREFRRDLPSDSETAQAIDRGASLAEISEKAEAEGVHQLSAVLFEAQQEDQAHFNPKPTPNLVAEIDERLSSFRADLPDGSQTAKAIDKGASWSEIAGCAQKEGLSELAAVLHEADQERMRATAG